MRISYDRVLVTGGAGFVGSHTVDALLGLGIRTWVLDDLSSGSIQNLSQWKRDSKMHFVRGTVRDFRKIRTLSRKVDAIIHLAAQISPYVSMSSPEITNATNVDGTLNVLRASVKEEVPKVVFASSSSVYGEVRSRRISESALTNPITPYGASKLAAEKYCGAFFRAYRLPTISLRYFNVYGERQSSNPYSGVIAIFARALIDGQRPTIFGDGYQTRDFIHVSDVARSNVAALQSTVGLGQAFNVGTGQSTTVRQLFQLLCWATRRNEIRPAFRKAREGDIKNSCADMTRTRSVLHYAPHLDLKAGLSRLIRSLNPVKMD